MPPPSVGIHVIANVYNIPLASQDRLSHLDLALPALEALVRQLRLTVVAQTGHQFSPKGYTYAFVLAESHFTIHTYPEHNACYMDLFCCSPSFHPAEAIRAIQELFQTDHIDYQVLTR